MHVLKLLTCGQTSFFPEEHADAILQIGQTAKGIEALEFIMSKVGSAQMSADAGLPTGMTEDKLRSMMTDERYWNPAKRDPAYVKEVQAGFFQSLQLTLSMKTVM